ncbi:MAG: hypothetical protein IPI49_13100 [Myxococcales bacterium]|nr:hypothetical protein [Myxococcales bacterium]
MNWDGFTPPGAPPDDRYASGVATGTDAASVAHAARPRLGTAYVAPRDDTERALAAIWSELLGIGELGVHDDFFELGGHSLLATQVAARIRAMFHLDLQLRALFEQPTIAALAEHVAKAALARRLRAPAERPGQAGAPGEAAPDPSAAPARRGASASEFGEISDASEISEISDAAEPEEREEIEL